MASDASHEHWSYLRKAAHRALNQTYGPAMSNTDSLLSTMMRELVEDFRSHKGKVVDVREHIYDFVCKTIAVMMTGQKPANGDSMLAQMKKLEKATRIYLNALSGFALDLFPWTRYLGNPVWSQMKEVRQT